MSDYDFNNIEEKWQKHWEKTGSFRTLEDDNKEKYYVLEQFPYPSGDGLHMGHARVYTVGDVLARFKRFQGYNVLHPMGADAFGLPAENAAIQRGVDPSKWTINNMGKIISEQKRIGISYDWERYIATCLPDYYKHTQYLFLEMLEKQLAYRKKGFVNWCDVCSTVLANEQVEDGKCWRCNSVVIKRDLNQWYIKITDYQDELVDDLEELPEWPSTVKTMQKNWIGRVAGLEVSFQIKGTSDIIPVFIEEPSSLINIPYIEISPFWEMTNELIKLNDSSIHDFIFREKNKMKVYKNKNFEGYFTGAYCLHPITKLEIPIYVTNSFEQESNKITLIGKRRDNITFPVMTEHNNQKEILNDLILKDEIYSQEEFDIEIKNYLLDKQLGKQKTTYKLRDWLISRQRYWGCPIPIVYCDDCGLVPVPYEQLPVILPENVTFNGKENPIKTSSEFVNCACPTCGSMAKRETDTMDTFIDSSWYYLRYIDPKNESKPFEPGIANKWMPVNEYVGGIEHAVLHLLYSRFITKFLYNQGYINFKEPFKKLITQGMVLKDGQKMSKSKGNVVSPNEVIDQYGADTLRLFVLFAAPVHKDLEWSQSGVEGSYRFLRKLWNYTQKLKGLKSTHENQDENIIKLRKLKVKTIKKVTRILDEGYSLNTAISSIMELLNYIYSLPEAYTQTNEIKHTMREVLILLAPFTPHITEEIWHELEYSEGSIHNESWPSFDDRLLSDEVKEIIIQVNGKVRDVIQIEGAISEEKLKEQIFQLEKIRKYLKNNVPKKTIVIPNKLVNIVL